MYRIFHDSIKCFSLIVGHLNLLRSSCYTEVRGDVGNQKYIIIDQAVIKFKQFCQKTIVEIEKLLSEQNVKIKLCIEDLTIINKLVNDLLDIENSDVLDDLSKNLIKIENFINFLINDFPHKNINQVDLTEIKEEIVFFKYQIYLS